MKKLKAESLPDVWVLRFDRTATKTRFEQIDQLLDHPMVGIFA
jgi:hypothetical protein